jgi:hypothetical protein
VDGRNGRSRGLTGHGRFISGVVVGMLIAGAFAGGTALASIPTSGTKVINGCRNVKTGALRVIDAQAHHKCAKGELPLNWNAQGVPGTPGKQGANAVKYWAAVGYDGSVIASSGGISVVHSSTGNYQVTLPAGVNAAACASVASVTNTLDMVATPSGAMGNSLSVLVRSQEAYPYNGYYDGNFSLAVLC